MRYSTGVALRVTEAGSNRPAPAYGRLVLRDHTFGALRERASRRSGRSVDWPPPVFCAPVLGVRKIRSATGFLSAGFGSRNRLAVHLFVHFCRLTLCVRGLTVVGAFAAAHCTT